MEINLMWQPCWQIHSGHNNQIALLCTFSPYFPVTTLIFTSKASCLLGPSADCCIVTEPDEKLNHDLQPYHEYYGIGKIHTSAISCIQPCCFHLFGPCFMGSRVCFIQHIFPEDTLLTRRALCGCICSPIGHSHYIHISHDRTIPAAAPGSISLQKKTHPQCLLHLAAVN